MRSDEGDERQREEQSKRGRDARGEERDARAPGADEIAEYPGAEVTGAGLDADQNGGERADDQPEDVHAAAESVCPSGERMVGGVAGVLDRGDGEEQQQGADRHDQRPGEHPAVAAKNGELGGDQPPRDRAHVVSVALVVSFVEQVSRDEHRPALVHELADEVSELGHAGRIEPICRLVEDQQFGIAEQGAGKPESLAHAERVVAHSVICAIEQSAAVQARVDPRGVVATRSGGQLEVLASTDVVVKPRLLHDRPDPGQARGSVLVQRETSAEPFGRRVGGEDRAGAHAVVRVDRIPRRVLVNAITQAAAMIRAYGASCHHGRP